MRMRLRYRSQYESRVGFILTLHSIYTFDIYFALPNSRGQVYMTVEGCA
jgi:hypothetical protein